MIPRKQELSSYKSKDDPNRPAWRLPQFPKFSLTQARLPEPKPALNIPVIDVTHHNWQLAIGQAIKRADKRLRVLKGVNFANLLKEGPLPERDEVETRMQYKLAVLARRRGTRWETADGVPILYYLPKFVLSALGGLVDDAPEKSVASLFLARSMEAIRYLSNKGTPRPGKNNICHCCAN